MTPERIKAIKDVQISGRLFQVNGIMIADKIISQLLDALEDAQQQNIRWKETLTALMTDEHNVQGVKHDD